MNECSLTHLNKTETLNIKHKSSHLTLLPPILNPKARALSLPPSYPKQLSTNNSMTDQTHTCTNASCGYKDTFTYTQCPKCGWAMSTNRNPNSTPTPASVAAEAATIGEMTAVSSSSSSSTAPHPNAFNTRTVQPQPRQTTSENIASRHILDPILQRHVQRHEEEKKAARIAEYREAFEKARGFEDDDEFYPGAGKEDEKKDKGKGKEGG
jgi:hypothetical protein